MNVLVTGGAGFIGGHLVNDLKQNGVKVLGIDNFSPYYEVGMKRKKLEFFEISGLIKDVDVANEDDVRTLFEEFKPTHVVHLAAQGGVRASKTDPKPYLMSNQIGFLNILNAAEAMKVQKFIYASSSSVYGDTSIAPFEESEKLSAPKSLYALSKLSNELVARYLPINQTQRIGLRFFTVYGPWGRPDMAIFRLLACSILEKPFYLTANVEVQRDFTFVSDVSKVILDVLNDTFSSPAPIILNVAGGRPYTLSELFKILSSLGIDIDIRSADVDPLDVKMTNASIKALKANNLSVPDTTLLEGLKSTWEWMKKQDLDDLRNWLDR